MHMLAIAILVTAVTRLGVFVVFGIACQSLQSRTIERADYRISAPRLVVLPEGVPIKNDAVNNQGEAPHTLARSSACWLEQDDKWLSNAYWVWANDAKRVYCMPIWTRRKGIIKLHPESYGRNPSRSFPFILDCRLPLCSCLFDAQVVGAAIHVPGFTRIVNACSDTSPYRPKNRDDNSYSLPAT